MRVAQRFIAGAGARKSGSPGGTIENTGSNKITQLSLAGQGIASNQAPQQ